MNDIIIEDYKNNIMNVDCVSLVFDDRVAKEKMICGQIHMLVG